MQEQGLAAEPPVHRLAGETIPFGHLAQRGAEDLEHCLVPLFHKSQLHKHEPHPLN